MKDALFEAPGLSEDKELSRYIRKSGSDILKKGSCEDFLVELEAGLIVSRQVDLDHMGRFDERGVRSTSWERWAREWT